MGGRGGGWAQVPREAQVTYVQGDLSGHDAEDTLLKLGIHVLSLLCPFVTLCNCAERRQARWLLLARAGSGGLVGGAGGAAGGVGSRRWAGSGGSVGGATVGTRPLRGGFGF